MPLKLRAPQGLLALMLKDEDAYALPFVELLLIFVMHCADGFIGWPRGCFQPRCCALSHVGCWEQPVCLEGVCCVCLDQLEVAVLMIVCFGMLMRFLKEKGRHGHGSFEGDTFKN